MKQGADKFGSLFQIVEKTRGEREMAKAFSNGNHTRRRVRAC